MQIFSNEPAFFSCPTRVHFGVGARARIPDIAAAQGWRRMLAIVDPALVESRILTEITSALDGQGVALARFSEIEPEPKDTSVHAALDLARGHATEAILALGGGSAIDVAKTVSIMMTNPGQIADFEGISRFSVLPMPMIAVPSTAGTGAEVSGACVITDTGRGVKMAIRHPVLGPAAHAVLDPLAVSTAPAHVAAHSGVDAFVHAFESYLSKQSNLMSDAVNLQAMRMIHDHIRPHVANRAHPVHALQMQCGAALAALSFGQTGTGNVHCMAMAAGGRFPVPHGLANAVCLPHVARFNLLADPARFAEVARAMRLDVAGLSDLEAGRRAVEGIERLCRDLDIPSHLRAVGVSEESLPDLAQRAFDTDYNRWNPRYTTRDDYEALFRAAY